MVFSLLRVPAQTSSAKIMERIADRKVWITETEERIADLREEDARLEGQITDLRGREIGGEAVADRIATARGRRSEVTRSIEELTAEVATTREAVKSAEKRQQTVKRVELREAANEKRRGIDARLKRVIPVLEELFALDDEIRTLAEAEWELWEQERGVQTRLGLGDSMPHSDMPGTKSRDYKSRADVLAPALGAVSSFSAMRRSTFRNAIASLNEQRQKVIAAVRPLEV